MEEMHSYIKRVEGIKTYGDIMSLQEEMKQKEHEYRKLYEKDRDSPILQNSDSLLINIFQNINSFVIREETADEKNIPKIFSISPIPAGSPAIVQTQDNFIFNFNLFLNDQFSSFNSQTWENVFVAGGSILASLLPIPDKYKTQQTYYNKEYKTSDVDLYIYGLDPQQANRKVQEIFLNLSMSNESVEAFRTKNAITFVSHSLSFFRPIQIILGLFKSPAEILVGFDVDACAVGYDGKSVWTLPRAHEALVTRCNTIDMLRTSPNYETRLTKYAKRGFRVAAPFLDREKVNPAIFSSRVDSIHGLARLLVFEKNKYPEQKKQFKRKENYTQIIVSKKEIPWVIGFTGNQAKMGSLESTHQDDWVKGAYADKEIESGTEKGKHKRKEVDINDTCVEKKARLFPDEDYHSDE